VGRLLLVRHGQASFGADDYDVLSETGWAQGRALGAWLAARGERPTAYARGGLRRHRETLEALLEGAGGAGWDGPDALVDPDWDEFDHVGVVASWPGLAGDVPADRRDFQRAFEQATAAWTAGEHDGAGESYLDFVTRVRGALVRATAAAGSGETVLVVTSGGPIAVAAATLVDPEGDDPVQTARLWLRFNTVTVNSAVTRVVAGATGARLLTFNEHPHLEGDLLTYR